MHKRFISFFHKYTDSLQILLRIFYLGFQTLSLQLKMIRCFQKL
jgi:hypothetical protein